MTQKIELNSLTNFATDAFVSTGTTQSFFDKLLAHIHHCRKAELIDDHDFEQITPHLIYLGDCISQPIQSLDFIMSVLKIPFKKNK